MLRQLGRTERERESEKDLELSETTQEFICYWVAFPADMYIHILYIYIYTHAVHAYIHCVVMKHVYSCRCFTVFLVPSLYDEREREQKRKRAFAPQQFADIFVAFDTYS